MTDTIFADVSYFQAKVDDSYPYKVLSIRSNDGTFRDSNFLHNYQWCVNACENGRMTFFIVYFYWRVGSGDVDTHIDMVTRAGGPHPKMVSMIDLESGGNPSGDQSNELNGEFNRLVGWLGHPLRVISYANTGDYGMWRNHPASLRWVGAGYGRDPHLPNQIAHQYTDGNGYGGGLPEGAPPFGNCDMNTANGLDSVQFAAACGVGGPVSNAIDEQYKIAAWLGKRLSAELPTPDGRGRFSQFENGYIYWTPETGARPIPAHLFETWAAFGYEAGSLGYPTQYHSVLKDGDVQAFEHGVLYRKYGQPGFFVTGVIGDKFRRTGYEGGSLGWPTSNEVHKGGLVFQTFEKGTVAWSPDSTVLLKPGQDPFL